MSDYNDDLLAPIREKYGLSDNSTPEGRRRADALRRELARDELRSRGQGRVEYGRNDMQSEVVKVVADELLYDAKLKPMHELDRNCEPGTIDKFIRYCSDALKRNGSIPPPDNQPLKILTRAMSSSDIVQVLTTAASGAYTLGIDGAPEIYELFTKEVPVRNFLEIERVTLPEIPAPKKVGPNGELTHAQMGESGVETGAMESYASIIKLTRERMLNDQVGDWLVSVEQAGRADKRAVGNRVFAILSVNPEMADGFNIFSSDHNNLGTPGAPSITTLDELRTLMGAQTGPSGETMNIRPRIIVAAPGMEGTLAVLREAQNASSPNAQSSGFIATLTDARLSGNSWFAFASPQIHAGMEILVPQGGSAFRFERRETKTDDAVYFIHGVDFHVMVTDYRTLAKNAGS